jgi:hypothetical protein
MRRFFRAQAGRHGGLTKRVKGALAGFGLGDSFDGFVQAG